MEWIGVIGIIVGLVFFVIAAMKGWNVLITSVVTAVIIAVTNGMGIADDENAADLAAAQEFRQRCQAVQPGREYGMRRERKLFHEHVLRWG